MIRFIVGLLIAAMALVALGAATGPNVTVPPDPGFVPHCGFGPNDDDVRGVVRVGPATSNPPCTSTTGGNR